jgi:hypothetical protein
MNLTVEQMRSALYTATESKMHARARRSRASRRPACNTMSAKMLVAPLHMAIRSSDMMFQST